jgi:hypothetical protein
MRFRIVASSVPDELMMTSDLSRLSFSAVFMSAKFNQDNFSSGQMQKGCLALHQIMPLERRPYPNAGNFRYRDIHP